MNNNALQPQEQNENSSSQNPNQKNYPRWGRILAWIFAWVALFFILTTVGLALIRNNDIKIRSNQNIPSFIKNILDKIQQFSQPISIGKKVPDFTLTTFDGEQITLSSLQGKVIVLNFWASWCEPCEEEAADLEAAWKYYQPRGDVVFLGIDWTDTEKNGKAYLEKFDITYPNGQDLGTRISQIFRLTGVPETYIVDKDGNLASMKLFPYNSLEEIISEINPLLE
jgi:cytochrome c biogenesis protein CcmG/thiol:disulfide interchange protein DsbE